jgi:hypothetical protein
MATTWAALTGEVGDLVAEWRTDRLGRQARRGLDPNDFARLAGAGFLDVAVPEARGGLWRSVAETTGPICAVLRTLAAADPSVALVASMHPSVIAVGLACFVIGAGLGLVASPSLIAAQSSVGWSERGVVTGANLFSRSMGSAVGVAALGALVNGLMHGDTPAQDPAQFGDAVTVAFVAVAVVAVATVAAAAAMPRRTGSLVADVAD